MNKNYKVAPDNHRSMDFASLNPEVLNYTPSRELIKYYLTVDTVDEFYNRAISIHGNTDYDQSDWFLIKYGIFYGLTKINHCSFVGVYQPLNNDTSDNKLNTISNLEWNWVGIKHELVFMAKNLSDPYFFPSIKYSRDEYLIQLYHECIELDSRGLL